jgi:Xaa-Pro aminopeptidase
MLCLPWFKKEEFEKRVERLQRILREQKLEGALLTHRINRYYFTGTAQMGYVLITPDGEPLVLCRKDFDRAGVESVWPVEPLPSVRDLPALITARLGKIPSPLGVEMELLPVVQFDRLAKSFPQTKLVDSSHAIMLTRAVKSETELVAIRNSAEMVRIGAGVVPSVLREGMTELQLAAEIEYAMRKAGHAGYTPMRGYNQWLFYGHVMAGESAAEASGYDMPTSGRGLSPLLGQASSQRPIRAGEPVSVDLVGNCGGYLSDQTRLFSLGKVNEPFEAAFEASRRIQEEVAKAARPGAIAGDLYKLAVTLAEKTPYFDNFLGEGDKVSFVGHGIGLEVDEYPFLANKFPMALEEGMVFALEPKFIFRGRGVAGIEDTYVVRADGAQLLTSSPRELIVI